MSTATLGEMFDRAFQQLSRAARSPGESDQERGMAVLQLRELVIGLKVAHYASGASHDATVQQMNASLTRAQRSLEAAVRVLPADAVDIRTEVRLGALGEAVRTVRTTTDLIRGHHVSEDGPSTPYAALLRAPSGRAYLASRTAELSRTAARLAGKLREGAAQDESVGASLLETSEALAHVAGLLPRMRKSAEPALRALPQTVALSPAPFSPTETPKESFARLHDSCERLSRIAHEEMQGRQRHQFDGGFGGGAIAILARTRTVTLSNISRLILQVEPALRQNPPLFEACHAAGGLLTGLTRSWQNTAVHWRRVIDPLDMTQEPAVHEARKAVPAAASRPPNGGPLHPAVSLARADANRICRLIFGPDWHPRAPLPVPRSGSDILADMGGPAGLTGLLHQFVATDWKLGVAATLRTFTLRSDLLTRNQERQLYERKQFRQLNRGEWNKLKEAGYQVVTASESVGQSLLAAAPVTGMDCGRARLETLVHQNISGFLKGVTAESATVATVGTPSTALVQQVLRPSRGIRV